MKKIICSLKSTVVLIMFVLLGSAQLSARTVVSSSVGNEIAPSGPTLTSVAIAPSCVGSSAVVSLGGLQPSAYGKVKYTLSNGAFVYTEEGTSTASGTYAFNTVPVLASTNGLVLTIVSIENSAMQVTTFEPGELTATFVVKPVPTLGTVTSTSSCAGGTLTVTLSGLLPNKSGVATYTVGASGVISQAGTSDAAGNYSFTTPASAAVNGQVLTVTSITIDGCTTMFTGKTTTLTLLAQPTLGTVTSEITCAGTPAIVVLSGLNPNTMGTATYRVGGGPLVTQSGTSDANGVFSFPTNPLPADANGVVIEITKITTAAGCTTNFTNKRVSLRVQRCKQILAQRGVENPEGVSGPTLTSVAIAPACVGSNGVVMLGGLQPLAYGKVSYTLSNGAFVYEEDGFAEADGTYTFNTVPVLSSTNGLVLTIVSIENAAMQVTNFAPGQMTATFVVNAQPTLGTVTSTSECQGGTLTVTLSGLLPNKSGVATYTVGASGVITQAGTSDAAGNYSFTTPASAAVNGQLLTVTSITIDGCTTNFTNKSTTLTLLAQPTLGTVTSAITCAGTPAIVVLSGLNPNTMGTATYKVGGGPLVTQSGMSDANGVFSFPTNPLPADANGVVIEITKITTAAGCTTNFTNKRVSLRVQLCKKPLAQRGGENSNVSGKEVVNVASDLKLYPNPAQNVLNIDTAAEGTTVEVLNLQGQRMLTSTERQVNISNLPIGTYLVRVQDAQNNVVVKRVIKN